MGPILQAERLSKRYGERCALDEVSFAVQPGEVVGLLGANGAGKTTTLRLLTGSLPATAGTARVAGVDVRDDPLAARRRIGYLPERPALYGDLTVREQLRFAGSLRQLRGRDLAREVDRVSARCGLESVLGQLVRQLSHGFRRRAGLAQALLGAPEVLILDEPTAGLDPRQIGEVRALIAELAGRHTVVLSTHVLGEVVASCSRVLILSRGRLVADDSLGDLVAHHGATRDAPALERVFLALTEP